MRPSKPQAIVTAVLGAALLVFGITQFVGRPFSWFFVAWVVVGLLVIGLTLRAGLGRGRGRWLVPSVELDESADTSPDGRPQRYRAKPSKPMAVLGAVFGAALLVFGITRFAGSGQSRPFLVLWVVFGLVIIGFNLWSAFSRKGSSYTLERHD